MSLVSSVWLVLRAVFLPRAVIVVESLALRQQRTVLRVPVKHARAYATPPAM